MNSRHPFASAVLRRFAPWALGLVFLGCADRPSRAQGSAGDGAAVVRLVVAAKYPAAAAECAKLAEGYRKQAGTATGYDATVGAALEIYWLCAMAQACALDGQPGKARAALAAAVAISDGNADVHGFTTGAGVRGSIDSTKGFLAEKSGDRAEAERIYAGAPTDYGRARRALRAVEENRLADAKNLAAAGDSPTAQIVLGLVAQKEGRGADAAAWFGKARKQRAEPRGNIFFPIYWCEAPPGA